MSYKDLIKIFRVFAAQHPILQNHFSWGQLSDYQREEYIQKYPAIHFVPIASVIDNTNSNFNFNVLIFDLNNEWKDMSPNSNQLDSLSLCYEILNDFYSFFINQTTNYGFYLQNPISFQPFLDKWKEAVVGVEAQITIVCEQTACIPPYIEEQALLYEDGLPITSEDCNVISYTSEECPNQTISQLPTFSGDVNGGWVIFNNSGNTITYKLNVDELKGNSGTSGTSGTSGLSGSSGTSGTSGLSGSSGTSGTSGENGSSGTSGTSGENGISGSSGTSGTSGSSSAVDVYSGGTLVVSQAVILDFSGATISSGGTGVANIVITGGGSGTDPIRVLNQTLEYTGWTYNTGTTYYDYSYSYSAITSNSRVDFVPYNASVYMTTISRIQPYNSVGLGSSTFYSQYPPSQDITGDIYIFTTT